jgi:hypothetical protein
MFNTAHIGKSGTGGTISDVPVISIVWLAMIGDFQSRGNFLATRRHCERPAAEGGPYEKIRETVTRPPAPRPGRPREGYNNPREEYL